ncbi:MAG: hypothetical protein ABI874_08645 [Chloroflexota bacterium]
MAQPKMGLDAKSEKLLKQVNKLLDDLLTADSGTALSVAHPRLKAAIDELANHRYALLGNVEPHGTKR